MRCFATLIEINNIYFIHFLATFLHSALCCPETSVSYLPLVKARIIFSTSFWQGHAEGEIYSMAGENLGRAN